MCGADETIKPAAPLKLEFNLLVGVLSVLLSAAGPRFPARSRTATALGCRSKAILRVAETSGAQPVLMPS